MAREARRRLKASSEPYWLVIERGLSLGYRKSAEGGAWLVRRYDTARRRHFERRLATADDNRDADGADVLNFGQAQRRLLEQVHEQALEASGERYTVADAVRDYLEWMRRHRKTADYAEQTLKAYVLATPLADKRLADLTAGGFRGVARVGAETPPPHSQEGRTAARERTRQ